MTPPRGDAAVDARLAVVESNVAGLQTATNKLENEFVRLESAVTKGFETLGEKIALRDRTPWATIFSALGVLLGILIALGALAYRPMDLAISYQEKAIAGLERRLDRLEAEVMWRRQRYQTKPDK